MPPGGHKMIDTYVGHLWLVTDQQTERAAVFAAAAAFLVFVAGSFRANRSAWLRPALLFVLAAAPLAAEDTLPDDSGRHQGLVAL